MAQVELGDKVKDTVSGFTGIAIGKTQWLHGCNRITVKPDSLKDDGSTLDSETFDEPQLVVVKKKKVPIGRRDTGGPGPEPVQKSSPPRHSR